ncbi:MAG TPA: hypothetical protein VM690_00285 [Gaiellaceae bacterium]|nr:hypothetical protein [Gaiellaceae bacterium]
MARALRDTAAGFFHVYTHSVWAAPNLFRDDQDRVVFIRELAQAVKKARWTCLAFCLMTTHYHLVLEVEDGALPVGMHALNFRFAAHFNKRHSMKGHVLGTRYGARRLVDGESLRDRFRYIVLNPVEAMLCKAPGEWEWSSYPGLIGLAEPHSFVDATRVIELFEGSREVALGHLRRYVEES